MMASQAVLSELSESRKRLEHALTLIRTRREVETNYDNEIDQGKPKLSEVGSGQPVGITQDQEQSSRRNRYTGRKVDAGRVNYSEPESRAVKSLEDDGIL